MVHDRQSEDLRADFEVLECGTFSHVSRVGGGSFRPKASCSDMTNPRTTTACSNHYIIITT